MFIQCAKRVVCPIDGQARTFFFQAIYSGSGWRPGYRHGCNEKTGAAACIDCWRRVRADVFLRKK